MALDEEEPNE